MIAGMRATFYGELIARSGENILFSVAARLGDAPLYGIRGQIWLEMGDVQYHLRAREEFDAVVCSLKLAQELANSCGSR